MNPDLTPPPPPPRTRTKAWIAGALVIAIAGGSWAYVARKRGGAHAAATGGAAPSPDARVVPVVAAPVIRRDMPIYLEGLGNVAAFNTVTVKPQIDGRLERVAFREGQDVKRGDVIALIDPRPFQLQVLQAQAALARDESRVSSDKRTFDRTTALYKESLVSQQQLDDARAALNQSSGVLGVDRAQIESAKLLLGYARITSPIDGVTGVRLVDQGNIVHANDPNGLVVITQIDPIAVFFTLPEDDLPRIGKQLAAGPVSVEAFSRDGGVSLGKGQVALIDNQINQTTATIRLKAVFDNPGRVLWPNQFVKARVLLSTRANALVVPAAAIQRGPNGTFVYIIEADQKVAVRPVQVDSTEGETAVLAGGVDVGDQVVADGQYQLRPGSKVAPRQAGPKPGGPPKPAPAPSGSAAGAPP